MKKKYNYFPKFTIYVVILTKKYVRKKLKAFKQCVTIIK